MEMSVLPNTPYKPIEMLHEHVHLFNSFEVKTTTIIARHPPSYGYGSSTGDAQKPCKASCLGDNELIRRYDMFTTYV
jgi:hypothetical protein